MQAKPIPSRIQPQNIAPARRGGGFTLLEMLVVLALVAMLAAIVGPNVMSKLGSAKGKTAAVQISNLENALNMYKLDVGRYPSNSEGLQALVQRPGSAGGWDGPYIDGKLPDDPWGNPYRYSNPGPNGGIEILTLGADNAPGGDGENADVSNNS